jgi:hypothetical protein
MSEPLHTDDELHPDLLVGEEVEYDLSYEDDEEDDDNG